MYYMNYSPLISVLTINSILISVHNSSFTPFFFKAASHSDLGTDKK